MSFLKYNILKMKKPNIDENFFCEYVRTDQQEKLVKFLINNFMLLFAKVFELINHVMIFLIDLRHLWNLNMFKKLKNILPRNYMV